MKAVDALTGLELYEAYRKHFLEKDFTGMAANTVAGGIDRLTGIDPRVASFQAEGKLGQIARGVEQGVGGMLPAVAISVATMGAGAPAALSQGLSLATTGVQAGGQGMQEAYREGAGDLAGLGYGVATGAVEAGTEKLFGGVGKEITGKGWFDDIIPSVANKGAVRYVRNFLEEGGEEVIAEMASPALKGIYKGAEGLEAYKDPEHYKAVAEAGITGGLTALVYAGTVGYGMSKAGIGFVGKEADMQSLMEDVDGLKRKERNLRKSIRLTGEKKAEIDGQVRERYADVEGILKSVDQDRREKMIETFALDKAFDKDGNFTEDFRRRLGMDPESGSDATARRLHPEFFKGDRERVSAALEAAGLEAVTDMESISREERASYRQLLSVAEKFDDLTGGNFDFVITEASEGETGAYSRRNDVIMISRETLKSPEATAKALYNSWFGVTIEESLHKTANKTVGGNAYTELWRLMSQDKAAKDDVISRLIDLGYLGEDKMKARGELDRILHKKPENMTSEEKARRAMFADELIAHLGRDKLSTRHFFERLIREDKSAAERFLEAVRGLRDRLGKRKKGEGAVEAEIDLEALRLEGVFLAAVRECGGEVDADGHIIGVNDREEDETGIRFSKKISNYPYDMQKVIREYLDATDEEILNFVESHTKEEGKMIFGRHKISDVSERQIEDVQKLIGIDISGYTNNVNTNAIAHIETRHGLHGKADDSMSNKKDIARVGYILENYDTVRIALDGEDAVDSREFRDRNNEPAPMLVFSKKINGTYYTAMAIPESKWKKLWVVSAYIGSKKNETVTQALGAKGSPTAGMSLASPASTEGSTIKDASSASIIVAQKQPDVKPSGENISDDVRRSRKATADAEYLKAVNSGDIDTAESMVYDAYEEYAEKNNVNHEKAAELFYSEIEKVNDDDNWDIQWGIRFDKRLLVPESVFPKSHELFQDPMYDSDDELLYPEGEGYYQGYYDAGELDGTSTLGIDISDDKEDVIEQIEKHLCSMYEGEYVYLVSGYSAGRGNDIGEILIRDAKVVSVLNIYRSKTVYRNGEFFYERIFTNKSSEITFDDNGNVIPLSKRFDMENDDVRFSKKVKLGEQEVEVLDGDETLVIERGKTRVEKKAKKETPKDEAKIDNNDPYKQKIEWYREQIIVLTDAYSDSSMTQASCKIIGDKGK